MDANAALAEILENLPRQHLRTKFKNRFGTEEAAFDDKTFARGAVLVDRDRKLSNLMQEEPEVIEATFLYGTADALRVSRTKPNANAMLSALFADANLPTLAVLHGVTARLYAYFDPEEEQVWVRRIAVAKENRPGAKPPKPVLSRRQRAAAAGKMKPSKKPIARRGGPRR